MTGVWRSSRSVVVGIVDPHAPWYNIVNTQRPPGRADPQPSNIGRAAPLRGKCQIAGLGRSLAPRGDTDPVGLSWSLRRRGVRANPTPGATADTLLSRSLGRATAFGTRQVRPGIFFLVRTYSFSVRPVPVPLID